MARSNSIMWNIVLPIMVFLPMAYIANWILFGQILKIGLHEHSGKHCPTSIQGKLPFQRQYLGGYAPGLENILCIVVAFFYPLFQPEGEDYTPFIIDFLAGTLSACVLVPFIEESRSKRSLLLGFPVAMGIIMQIYTGALTFPPYWAAFLAMMRDHATGSEIAQADAEAILFGLIMGYFLPTFAMAYLATVEATAVWQIFPILIYFFKSLHLLFRPKRLHNSSGYRTIQATYILVFLISTIMRLRTFAVYNFNPRTVMINLLPPLEIPIAKDGQTAITLINLFLQWDAFFIFFSTYVVTLWFAGSILQGIMLIAWIAISSPILGQGATIAGIFLWREAKLNTARQLSTSKPAKTQ